MPVPVASPHLGRFRKTELTGRAGHFLESFL